MTPGEAVPILARWNRELRYDLERRDRTIVQLEERVHRLEQAVRRSALDRRHWIRQGMRV